MRLERAPQVAWRAGHRSAAVWDARRRVGRLVEPERETAAHGTWRRARLLAVSLVAGAAFLHPPASDAAAPAAGLSVTPSIVAGSQGTTATIWVEAPAGASVRPRVYAYDPASGRLSPPAAGEASWVSVAPAGGAAAAGRGEPFDVAVTGPSAPPAQDTYLDVVFAATRPGPMKTGSGTELAAGAVVAFRGSAPPPAGWTAALTGPHVLWLAGGSWGVRVQGAAGGWIAPVVRAQVRGHTSAVTLGPILPDGRAEARVRFRGGLPGVTVLRVQVQSGARTLTLQRRVLVLPGAAVLGALAGLGAVGGAGAWLRGRVRSQGRREP